MTPHTIELSGTKETHYRDKSISLNGMMPPTKRYTDSDISVLVVGAGVGGLLSALECWRKGHTVRILERSDSQIWTGQPLTPRRLFVSPQSYHLLKEVYHQVTP